MTRGNDATTHVFRDKCSDSFDLIPDLELRHTGPMVLRYHLSLKGHLSPYSKSNQNRGLESEKSIVSLLRAENTIGAVVKRPAALTAK